METQLGRLGNIAPEIWHLQLQKHGTVTILLACSIFSQYCDEINSQHADKIWRKHYESIISPSPNGYMRVGD